MPRAFRAAARFVGRTTRQIAPDEFGGVVIVRESGEDTPGGTWYHDSIRKVDGRAGLVAWEFFARHYYAHLGDVAIHPDGTVYVVEVGHNQPSRLLAINGDTGAVTSWDLPTGNFRRYVNGALSSSGPTVAHVAGPIVLEDGSVTLVSRVRTFDSYSNWDGYQTWWPAPGGFCTAEVRRFTLAEGAGAPTSAVVSTAAYPSSCSVPFYLEDYRLLPDGQGGLLLGHRKADFVMRLASNLTLSLGRTLRLDPPLSGTFTYATEYVLGDDAAYAFVSGVTSRVSQPPEYWTKSVGFRADTLAWFNEADVSYFDTAPRNLTLQTAMQGSGILVTGPEWDNAVQVNGGLWAAWGAAPALKLGLAVPLSTATWTSPAATGRRANAEPPKYGILVKGHTAHAGRWPLGPFRHASVRIVVPTAQFTQLPSHVRDTFSVDDGKPYRILSMGARPVDAGGGDSGAGGAPVDATRNHDSDMRNDNLDELKRVKYDRANENAWIATLVERYLYFQANWDGNPAGAAGNLIYEPLPSPTSPLHCTDNRDFYGQRICLQDTIDGYNSNSFVAGLLNATPLPLPRIGGLFFNWRYPGWYRPVPADRFGVSPP